MIRSLHVLKDEANYESQNWSPVKKWTLFTVCVYGMFCGIATAVANVLATPQQAEDWQVTPTQAAYSVRIPRLGAL